MTRQEFKIELLISATQRATEIGFNIDSDAISSLEDIIEIGVNRMDSSQINSPFSRGIAESNLMIIIDEMAKDARSRKLYENLDYESFINISLRICPLWPFC